MTQKNGIHAYGHLFRYERYLCGNYENWILKNIPEKTLYKNMQNAIDHE